MECLMYCIFLFYHATQFIVSSLCRQKTLHQSLPPQA